MKRRKRPPTLPPTQYLRPELMVEETEDEVLKRRRARGRKIGAERRHLDAQLTEDLAAIDADRGRHPNANSTQIAGRLQRNPATAVPRRKRGKPVLKDGKPVLLTVKVLARKITRARARK